MKIVFAVFGTAAVVGLGYYLWKRHQSPATQLPSPQSKQLPSSSQEQQPSPQPQQPQQPQQPSPQPQQPQQPQQQVEQVGVMVGPKPPKPLKPGVYNLETQAWETDDGIHAPRYLI